MIDFDDLKEQEDEEDLAQSEACAKRSAIERNRDPIRWAHSWQQQKEKTDCSGIFYGIPFPQSESGLLSWGSSWLTQAFKIAGTIPEGAEVKSIQNSKRLGDDLRGYAARILLEVTWCFSCRYTSTLHTRLLAKIPLPEIDVGVCTNMQLSNEYAEINAYRLLEGGIVLSFPRFYYGDLKPDLGRFLLITQWVPEVIDPVAGSLPQNNNSCQMYAYADSETTKVDLTEANLDLCNELICSLAQMAGRCKSHSFCCAEALDTWFPRTSGAQISDHAQIMGLAKDKAFVASVAMMQELIQNFGRAFSMPAHLIDEEAIKGVRALLVTGRQNEDRINWWIHFREELTALSFRRLDVGGAFKPLQSTCHVGMTRKAIGFCDWTGLSITSLGHAIWECLSCAHYSVIWNSMEGLLADFVKMYCESGGPVLEFDMLKTHVFAAAMIQGVHMLRLLPRICEHCPKSEWTSIHCLADPRLSTRVGEVPLWRLVSNAINFAVMIKRYNLGENIYPMFIVLHPECQLGCRISDGIYYVVANEKAEAHVSPDPTSSLICRFSSKVVLGTAVGFPSEGDWLHIRVPLPCWVRSEHLKPYTKEIEIPPEAIFEMGLLSVMRVTRVQHTGISPRHMCITSSRKLIEEIELAKKNAGLVPLPGYGSCSSHLGSFLAERHPRKWWPHGYQCWSHHTFVVFENGTIADITADQWDPLEPQLSWPADPSRYSFSIEEADASKKHRCDIGQDKWREMEIKDQAVGVYRTQLKWKQVEEKAKADGQTVEKRDERNCR